MKRRPFLQRMLLISGGLVLSSPFTPLLADPKTSIKGTVTSGRKKLKGVIVSDGYSVVQTNARGKYELPVNSNAKFVFVSIPSGYEFPNEKGIARHYQPISAANQSYNFELSPLQVDDTKHQFIIWADPQAKNKKDAERMLRESLPDTRQVIQSYGASALIHGITVGDIVWDNHALYEQYEEAVEKMGVPFFQALGNHDMDLNKGGDEVSDDTFEATYGPTYYSFNRGKVHYVVLEDVRYLGKDKEYDGYLTAHQLEWLKKDLAFVPKEHLVVIGLHIPVHTGVKNRDEFYEIIKDHKVHIMSGHTHYNMNVSRDGWYEHIHGAVCGALWTGPICGDGTPNGYGVYEVDGTDLKWYYKSTGYEKEYQMRLSVEQQQEETYVLANIWNWDEAWKVEWWADGKHMGELQNTPGLDPIAVALYDGKELPKGRAYVDPRKTEHLFSAPLTPGMKSIEVVATDRFGNKYESMTNVV